MSMDLPTLKLKPREDRRVRAGHLWVYSNELDTNAAFRQLAPGSLCRLEDARSKSLGIGYVNPQSLLALRLLTGKPDAEIDSAWFERRLRSALALRERLYSTPHYRLVHSEGDGLPGLIVDRYGDVLVLQFNTAGIEALREPILAALRRVLRPHGMVLANDGASRQLDGLPEVREIIGEVPEHLDILEAGLKLRVPFAASQKTGWFYDQVANRDRLARYVRGARVLDVFSYAGGWALRAAAAGASAVTAVDRSEAALDAAQANAAANGLTLETVRDEALDAMKRLRSEGRQFDVVVVDPPALIKRKKDFEAGFEHYAALNRAALQLLGADGILISCSCSHHLDADGLQRLLLRESRHTSRRLQLLEAGGQGPDHPVHPAIPETRYLKAYYCRASAG